MSAQSGAVAQGLRRVMPWVFVLIWSTGFIVARYGMPYAPPLKFLCLRYSFSLLVLLPLAWLLRTAWPRGWRQWMHLSIVADCCRPGIWGASGRRSSTAFPQARWHSSLIDGVGAVC